MQESQKPLIERLSFSGPFLDLEGHTIFATPDTHSGTRGINVIGVDETNGFIDIGTGECCYGYVHRLIEYKKNEGFKLDNIRHIDFDVHDLLSVVDSKTSTDLPNQQSILAVGHGCAGAGVRLIGMYYPISKEVLTAKEYYNLKPEGSERVQPRFSISEGRIHLDITGIARGFGPERDPNKPNMLHDLSDSIYSVNFNTFDLTERLADLGVDIAGTLEFAKNYERKWGR